MTLFGVKRYLGEDGLQDEVSLKRKADSGIESLISKVKLKRQKLIKKQKATDVENQSNEVGFPRSKPKKYDENNTRNFNQNEEIDCPRSKPKECDENKIKSFHDNDEIDFPRSKPKNYNKNVNKTSKKFATTSKNGGQKNRVLSNKEKKEIAATNLEKIARKEGSPAVEEKPTKVNTSEKKRKSKMTNERSTSDSPKEKLDYRRKVERQLPNWLTNPHIIEDDLSSYGSMECSKIKIDKLLIENLSKIGITRFFPVQFHAMSVILNDAMFGVGPCNYPPNDLCVSAPTGSGKTLAFALPIVQCLLNRVVPATRALVLLPTQELAAQVHSVFNCLCDGTSLKCALITGGMQSIIEEQEVLIKYRNGQRFQVDIIVATPGRLVNHLTPPNSLCLDYLRFLVIDEADRMMSNIKSNWLQVVEKTVYKNRPRTDAVTMDSINKPAIPLQKLLFSATLSADPVKLEELNLFQPQLYSAHFKPKLNPLNSDSTADLKLEKYVTPALLKEFMVVVSAKNKPLAVLHLISDTKKALCFTSSVESATRLSVLIQLFANRCGFENNFSCAEFSSKMNATKRRMVLKQFEEGSINVLVSSDAMARGIDVPEVSAVILYDVPPLIETYIHRVGRTARAGKVGTAYTITLPSEVRIG